MTKIRDKVAKQFVHQVNFIYMRRQLIRDLVEKLEFRDHLEKVWLVLVKDSADDGKVLGLLVVVAGVHEAVHCAEQQLPPDDVVVVVKLGRRLPTVARHVEAEFFIFVLEFSV